MILGGIRLWTYDSELTLKPGQGSSVTAAPPITPALLEDQRLEARLGKVGGTSESVVAAAHDDRVE